MANRSNTEASGVLSVIKERRRHCGFSQKDMAAQLKVNIKTYQRLESGQSGMSIEMFTDICYRLELRIQLVPKEYMIL